eukprot:9750196-Lingulodinium_polyedra.AAC.1
MRETGIYFLRTDGTEHMPVGSARNAVKLTPEQRTQNDEFLLIRRERHVEHDQRQSAMMQEERAIARRDARHRAQTEQPRSRGKGKAR